MSWQDCTLGDVVKLQRGHDLPDRVRVDGPVPVVSSSGITGKHNIAKAEPPGVVTGRYGTIGEVFYIEEPYWPLNTALYVVDFKGNCPRYAAYLLRNTLKNYRSEKAAVPGVDRNVLHTLKVRAPDRPTQERLVSVLSAYDDMIENNRKRITLLEEAAKLLYREWFVYLRFPGHEHISIVNGLPVGWERLAASEAFHINPPTPRTDEGEITYVPMASLSELGMLIDKRTFERRRISTGVRFRTGDTLFARITPCLENGKTGFVQFLQPEDVACGSTEFIVLRGRKVSNYFVYLTARQPDFRENAIKSMIGSSGRQRVQASCFDRYHVSVPPDRLASLFDETVSPLFQQVRVLDQQNQQLVEARDLLLPRLMNGEIAV
ncbi:restriction endonuclease subunit S [Paraburkholderia phymatum]|uniref:restriction endonuclease subunit S n=1 Tax=Paraburkholderia phymatum TaxID=148447 RepID=UPI00317FFEA6